MIPVLAKLKVLGNIISDLLKDDNNFKYDQQPNSFINAKNKFKNIINYADNYLLKECKPKSKEHHKIEDFLDLTKRTYLSLYCLYYNNKNL